MDISIIIVSYNKFEYLKRCLESIEKFVNEIKYEIIIVDNNSTQNGLENAVEDFANIVLHKNKKNVGFAAANNQGIKIAHGKFFLLLNNDTELTSNAIKECMEFVELNKNNKMLLGCQLLNSDGTKQESTVPFPSLLNIFTESFFLYKLFPKNKLFNKYYLNNIDIQNPIDVDVIKGAFMFGETETFIKANGFDERFFFYSEETDLCYRLKNDFGTNIIFNPNIKVFHHNNAEKTFKGWFHHKNISIGKIQYYQKHFNNMKKVFALSFHFLGNLLRILLNVMLGVINREIKYFKKANNYLRLLFIYPKNRFNHLQC